MEREGIQKMRVAFFLFHLVFALIVLYVNVVKADIRSDIYCMAEAMYFEARGEGDNGIGEVSVGHVIMNRVRSDLYPNSVCEVVYQRKQFSYFWDGKPEVIRDRRSWRRAIHLSALVLKGRVYDPTHGATHYHAYYVRPRWVEQCHYIVSIGSHLFYRLKS